ncbi:M24 family metallopeptidase [Halalkalibacter kiskunsagensis]|uniref:M24 family metallopeptidase n=1 Tax=Halalkalibacter kiskunsagensis TaxID=1548599 RepID=A0ABV6KEN5_9BACI
MEETVLEKEFLTLSPQAKIESWLQQKELDGILLRKRQNFSWITSGKANHIVNTSEYGIADLLILNDKKYCITVKMESRRIMEEELDGLGFELVQCEWYENPDELIKTLCEGKQIVADTSVFGLEDVSSELIALRSRLANEEVERYKWLCQKAATALESVCHEIEPGMSEFEIAALLSPKVIKDGINPQVILVATDERIYHYRHPIPTDKKLEQYAMIVICAEKWGLVANATRFVHFGELPELVKENKEKLAKIDITMNMATRPGARVNEVFQKGLEAYASAGYKDDWKLLHQGGLTGYASREYLANMNNNDVIFSNQAFAWNPAISGIKSEDTILVGENENQFLTHTGNWVYTTIWHDGVQYERPDVLIR